MSTVLLALATLMLPTAHAAEGDAKRGEYVAAVAGCATCHVTGMGPDAKQWAGGLKIFEGPPGTWVSPNITQHETTGIGKWTDEQIIKAIREGVRPDGSKLMPIMPYPYYNAMSDQDAKDLVAFLRTIEPVDNDPAPGDFKVPPVPVPAATGKGIPDRGEYLTTLAHCHVCHTPMDDKGAPIQAKAFAGGRPFPVPEAMGGGLIFSPNITPHEGSGIGKWTGEQVIASFTKMMRPDGRGIAPPMALYAPGWSKLTKEDKEAIAGYLKGLPAIDHTPPKNTAKPPPGK